MRDFKFAIVIILFFLCFISKSQNQVFFGANTGYGQSIFLMYGSSETSHNFTQIDTYNKSSCIVSIFAGAKLSDRCNIRTKFEYIRKGARLSGNNYIHSGNAKNALDKTNINVSYITIPLLLDVSFKGMKKFYFSFGPYISYLESAKLKGEISYRHESSIGGPWVSDEISINDDISEYFKKTTIGLSINLGVEIPFNEKLSLQTELESQLGITNNGFTSSKGNWESKSRMAKNMFACLSVGFKYYL